MILFLPVFLTLGALSLMLFGMERKRASLAPLADRLEPLVEGVARFRVHTMMRHARSLFSNYRVLDQLEREISVLEATREVTSQEYTGRFPMFARGRVTNLEQRLVTLEALRSAERATPPPTPATNPANNDSASASTDS